MKLISNFCAKLTLSIALWQKHSGRSHFTCLGLKQAPKPSCSRDDQKQSGPCPASLQLCAVALLQLLFLSLFPIFLLPPLLLSSFCFSAWLFLLDFICLCFLHLFLLVLSGFCSCFCFFAFVLVTAKLDQSTFARFIKLTSIPLVWISVTNWQWLTILE